MSKRKTQLAPIKRERKVFDAGGTISASEVSESLYPTSNKQDFTTSQEFPETERTTITFDITRVLKDVERLKVKLEELERKVSSIEKEIKPLKEIRSTGSLLRRIPFIGKLIK